MTTGIAVFTYAAWVLRYPEFTSVNSGLAQLYWNEAQAYVDNTPCSIIQDVNQRTTFLNMVTAHICALNAVIGGVSSSPLVGRISNATEGSVTVATQLDVPQGTPQFWAQSKYGIAFWVASSSYRMMLYAPGPRNNPARFYPGTR